MTIEEVVDKQLIAYNKGNYEVFASCYHEDILSYDLLLATLNPQMSGAFFFAHYRNKFSNNPTLHCQVTERIVHDDLVIDKELITGYGKRNHTELVIYQVERGRISKMWFSKEIFENLFEKEGLA